MAILIRSAVLLLILAFFPVLSISKSTYIVYMGHRSRDVSKEQLLRSHRHVFASVHQGNAGLGAIEESMLYSYSKGFNGFAALMNQEQATALERLPEVVSVFPARLNHLHTTRSWEFMGLENRTSGVVPDYSLWTKSNFGADAIIGSLDTGIWPEADSFKDTSLGSVPESWKGMCVDTDTFSSSSCNRKIIGARFYLRAYEAAEGHVDAEDDFRSPRDMNGHGTHTSSTAAGGIVGGAAARGGFAGGSAKGGAPRARLAAYKVCWPRGCHDADILAAMDDAIGDGVHVMTLSLGPSYAVDYFRDAISVGAFHAVDHGVLVACSAGNSGPAAASVVNVAPWILTVAASSIDREFVSSVVLGNNATYKGTSLSEFKLDRKKGLFPLISGREAGKRSYSKLASTVCSTGSLNPRKVRGKIVVCLRGITSRLSKAETVKQAEGLGMVLANSAADGNELLADSYVLPATQVDADSAKAIYTYITKTKNPMGYITPVETILDVTPAPKMAFFSSQGPNKVTPDILKPDVTAPGLNILAAFSQALGEAKFAVESGTSMSCPHVAAVAALLKALHPTWSPAAIKSAILTTATVHDNTGEMITDADGKAGSPFNYGSGHIVPNLAADPGLVYNMSGAHYISFLCATGYDGDKLYVLTGMNISCSGKETRTLNYPSVTVSKLEETITVERTVTNVGGTAAVYKVDIRPPPGVDVQISPQTLTFSSSGETQTFHLTLTQQQPQQWSTYERFVFGEFTWRDGRGHNVRSPIAVRMTKPRLSSYSSS